jgi:hypothetical protein
LRRFSLESALIASSFDYAPNILRHQDRGTSLFERPNL